MEKNYTGYSIQHKCPILTTVTVDDTKTETKTVFYGHVVEDAEGSKTIVYKATPPIEVTPSA